MARGAVGSLRLWPAVSCPSPVPRLGPSPIVTIRFSRDFDWFVQIKLINGRSIIAIGTVQIVKVCKNREFYWSIDNRLIHTWSIWSIDTWSIWSIYIGSTNSEVNKFVNLTDQSIVIDQSIDRWSIWSIFIGSRNRQVLKFVNFIDQSLLINQIVKLKSMELELVTLLLIVID